jgi:hypothetical protein
VDIGTGYYAVKPIPEAVEYVKRKEALLDEKLEGLYDVMQKKKQVNHSHCARTHLFARRAARAALTDRVAAVSRHGAVRAEQARGRHAGAAEARAGRAGQDHHRLMWRARPVRCWAAGARWAQGGAVHALLTKARVRCFAHKLPLSERRAVHY